MCSGNPVGLRHRCRASGTLAVGTNTLVVNGKRIRLTAVKDPAELKWGEVGADIVVESTGLFLTKETCQKHIDAGAKKVIEHEYYIPHGHHATMEPPAATARVANGKAEVWACVQSPGGTRGDVANLLGIPEADVTVNVTLLGGGFGRRGAVHDWVRQAVAIAKELPGTPVKLIWSREEDMTHGRYHPVTMCKLSAGLDAQGKLTALHMRISGQSILSFVFPTALQNGRDPVQFQGLNPGGPEAAIGYTFPNLLIDHAMRNPHVPPGFWRGVNLNQNAIYLECFIDEIAAAIAALRGAGDDEEANRAFQAALTLQDHAQG